MRRKISKEEYKSYRTSWDNLGDGNHVSDYPLHVDLELSSACESRCSFCPVTTNYADTPETSHLTKGEVFPIGYMKPSLFQKIIDEVAGKTKSIKLNWRGEATLNPKFPDLVDYVMKKDFIEVMINTHGNYPERKRDAIHKLDKVIFSIDSLKELKYESIRRNLSFKKLMDNFKHAYKSFKETGRPKIKVNMTVTNLNNSEVERFKGYFNDDVEVRFAPVFERTSNSSDYKLANLQITGRKNCKYPFQRVMVAWNGKTTGCCVPWNLEKSDLVTGDATKQTIKQIWDNDMSGYLRRDAKNANYTFKTCKGCTSWASYRVIDHEKLSEIY